MKKLIYSPQPNATPDEVMLVLKVFIVPQIPWANNDLLIAEYESLPPEAQRHFQLQDDSKPKK